MQFGETDPYGSFAALGTGFLYNYNAHARTLCIYLARRKRPLLCLELDAYVSADAPGYAAVLEKAACISALKYSGNNTLNLGDVLANERLPAILYRTTQLAQNAFFLKKGYFDLFQTNFTYNSDLKRITIQKVANSENDRVFHYEIEASTRRGHGIRSRSSTLHASLTYLSDVIVQDIIAKEFGYTDDLAGQRLLSAATTLSTLAFIINPGFDPLRKVTNGGTSLLSALSDSNNTSLKTT